jgi:hypothetical protein
MIDKIMTAIMRTFFGVAVIICVAGFLTVVLAVAPLVTTQPLVPIAVIMFLGLSYLIGSVVLHD